MAPLYENPYDDFPSYDDFPPFSIWWDSIISRISCMMEFHHIMMLIHHKIDDPINYSIAMFHCELVCFLPGRWPSHACRLRGNHWAGSPKPSQNIIWSAPSQKNLFNVFQRKLWLVVHKQQPCSKCRRWFWWLGLDLELDFSPHLEAFENIKVAVVLICQLLVPI